MKTVGTKLDNDEFDKFLEMCNEEGCSKSELLRKLVKNSLRERDEIIQSEESLPESKTKIVKEQPKAPVASWKLYDDNGRLIAQGK